jgi:hypothetical protein
MFLYYFLILLYIDPKTEDTHLIKGHGTFVCVLFFLPSLFSVGLAILVASTFIYRKKNFLLFSQFKSDIAIAGPKSPF